MISMNTIIIIIISLLTGYFIGKRVSVKHSNESNSQVDSNIGDVTKYKNLKLNLVVRTDLGMTKGKIAAQCGHATLACYKAAINTNPALVKAWEKSGQAKVALKCEGEDKLLELQAIAQSLGLPAQSIRDAGRTQIAPGSRTVLGVGPGPAELVDQVTGNLKLL